VVIELKCVLCVMSDVIKCHMGKVFIVFSETQNLSLLGICLYELFSLLCGELIVEVCLSILDTSCVISAFDNVIQ